jgi:hypothetical protein
MSAGEMTNVEKLALCVSKLPGAFRNTKGQELVYTSKAKPWMVCFDCGKVCVSDRYYDTVDHICGCWYCKYDSDRSYYIDRPDDCLAEIAGKELDSTLSGVPPPFIPSDVSRAAKLEEIGAKLCALPENDREQANITDMLTGLFGKPLPFNKPGVKASWKDRTDDAFWGFMDYTDNYAYEKAPQVDYVYPSPNGKIVVCTIYLHNNYHSRVRTVQDMYGDNIDVTTSMSTLYAYDFVAIKSGNQFYTFTDDFVKHMKAKKSPPVAATGGAAASSVSPIAGDTPAVSVNTGSAALLVSASTTPAVGGDGTKA